MTEQEKQWKENIYKNGLSDYEYLKDIVISFQKFYGA